MCERKKSSHWLFGISRAVRAVSLQLSTKSELLYFPHTLFNIKTRVFSIFLVDVGFLLFHLSHAARADAVAAS